MKLYDYATAPNPRRVRIFLAEKGVDVPLETVDILKRESRAHAFVEKNPFGGSPVLELDDGTCIAESVAICRYIEGVHPEPPLFGRTPVEQALVDMWLRRLDLYLMWPIGQVWIHDHPLTKSLGQQVKEAADIGRKGAERTYRILDAELSGRDFIAGESYTVADAVALATIDFGVDLVGVPYDDDLTNLKTWHESMKARPSAKA